MNDPMLALRKSAVSVIRVGRLSGWLPSLLADGLVLIDEGVYFGSELKSNSHLLKSEMGKTGREALVNKVRLDEVIDVSSEGWEVQCVGQGVMLGREVLAAAQLLTPLPVDVVISVNQAGEFPSSTFRFYVHRTGDLWINDNLAGFTEAVMIIRADSRIADERCAQPAVWGTLPPKHHGAWRWQNLGMEEVELDYMGVSPGGAPWRVNDGTRIDRYCQAWPDVFAGQWTENESSRVVAFTESVEEHLQAILRLVYAPEKVRAVQYRYSYRHLLTLTHQIVETVGTSDGLTSWGARRDEQLCRGACSPRTD
jgi:hypothetical protein